MNEDEVELLENLFAAALGSHKLSTWEQDFLADTEVRYKKYGSETRVSPKQWAVIKRMANKLEVGDAS